ncbi:arylsulfatase [Novipirellula sp. SH528]|uniref:arylsulfatase n=1 Tax=Novipirellula sp. SH528 TaxID=3454466 RepID=UPI003FA19344
MMKFMGILLISSLSFCVSIAAAERPNIILIMVDDMGWSDIGCYGSEIETPNLDRLAGEGMRFTQFYNNAKCTTTRASLVTGLWPRRDGGLLKKNMVTFGEVLKEAGYATALSGKWHLGNGPDNHPHKRGFEDYYGLLAGCSNHFDPAIPDPDYKGGVTRPFGQNDQLIKTFPADFYSTDAFTNHAIETISRNVTEHPDKPFFQHITYTAPHYPLHAKPDDIAKYKGKYMMGWDKLREQRYQRQIAMGLLDPQRYKLSGEDSRSYSWETANHEFEDQRMAVYAAMVDSIDQNIGRLMHTLSELKVDDNTLICFLSDNGGCSEEPGGRDPNKRHAGPADDYVAVGPAWGWVQNAPFRRYKSWTNEGGANTPMIAWWPGHIQANTITEQPGHIIDFMATFIEVAETDYPETYQGEKILPLEGTSLLPIFKGEQREDHDFYAWEWSGNRAYREGNTKVVWDSLIGKWELYDLSVDRTETNDLAATQPETTQRLAQAWQKWADMTGVKVKGSKNKKTKTKNAKE